MNIAKLTANQKEIIRTAIREALRQMDPAAVSDSALGRPGGLDELCDHLDELIEIVRRTRAHRIEPYQVQILDDVCPHCPHQQVNARCAFRTNETCLLTKYPEVIVQTIASSLLAIEDREYLVRHECAELNNSGGI